MKKKNKSFIGFGLLSSLGTLFFTILAILVVLIVPISLWTDRTLDFWCTYFSHHVVNVPIWMSCLVTFIGNGIIFLLNLISEIARLCVGI